MRTITKSTLYLVEGTAYLCALHQCIAPDACATSTHGIKIINSPGVVFDEEDTDSTLGQRQKGSVLL